MVYSRATAHMRTCAMRIRVAWRSPVPVYPLTLCVYPHSADEGIVSPRVSHPMDDISDVSRVEIPPTMILGSARPQITHLLLSASLHPRIPRTRMLYYAMGVYVHAAYCIRVLVLYSRTWCVYHTSHIPHSGCPIPGVPGSWTHLDLMDLRSNTLHLMIPGS